MDIAKIYKDSDGDECSIHKMIEREPMWAANRIQEGEKAIEKLKNIGIHTLREETFTLPLASCDFDTNDIILRATPEIMARGIHAGRVIVDLSDILGKPKKKD